MTDSTAPPPARSPATGQEASYAAEAAQFRDLYEDPRFPLERSEERATALEKLLRLGFPLRHDERWSHTPLRHVLRPRYRLPGGGARLPDAQPRWLPWQRDAIGEDGMDGARLVAVDGQIGGAAASTTSAAQRRLGGAAGAPGDTTDAFHHLRTVFGDDPHQVTIARGASGAPTRYHVAHLTSEGVVAAPRIRFVVEAGATATVVQSFESVPSLSRGGALIEAEASLCLPATELVVGEGARLELVRVQAEAESAFHVGLTNLVQGQGSEVRMLSIDIGAALTRNAVSAVIAGSDARCHLSGVTVAGSDQLIDADTVLEHAAPRSRSRQLFKRVLVDRARAVFAGRIVVRQAAQQTDAFQLNNNLLLGSGSAVSKPQLEIAADDVRCSHGATVGQLDDDQLFYLRSRGIPEGTATVMLAHGFCTEPLGEVIDPELRASVGALVAEALSARLASEDQ